MLLIVDQFIHAYKDLWTPATGKLLLVKREPTNSHDVNAVAVYKETVIVGHVPYYSLVPRLFQEKTKMMRKGKKTKKLCCQQSILEGLGTTRLLYNLAWRISWNM